MRSLPIAALILLASPIWGQGIDRGQVARVIDEGTDRSEVMTTAEHLQAADMRQGAIISATLRLDAANAAMPLPRPPAPQALKVSDPFAYTDPDK